MTVRTRSQIISDANSLIPDNTTGQVSPADVRGRVVDLADSVSFTAELGSAAFEASSAFAPASHVGAGGAAHAAVTTSANGFMTAADKTKLNGIETGAQVNPPVGTTSGTVAAGNDSRITGALQSSAIGSTVQPYDAATAKTNVEQVFSKSQRPGVTSLSVISGAISFLLADNNDFTVTLTANSTLNFPSDASTHVGQKGRILITQDSTGGRTLAVNASFLVLGSNSLPNIPSGSGKMAYLAYDVISATQIAISLTGVGE